MSDRTTFIEKIEQLPQKLESTIARLTDQQLDTPTGNGKWTIRQLVHHIADANLNAYTRMKLIATEDKPILKPYDQDQWSGLADAAKAAPEHSLNLIKALHQRWTQFLHSLPEASWTREGIHLENGKVTLDDVLKTYANHGESHRQQIASFREKMKW